MQNLYIGRAGQAVVMSEFLIRGYNVAAPEVDRGDDLFVVRDRDGDLRRIQVKTASARDRTYGYSAEFLTRYDRLMRLSKPDVTFVFVVRRHNRWDELVIIHREELFELHEMHGLGTFDANTQCVKFYLKFTGDNAVTCNDVCLAKYRDDWSEWPPIRHPLQLVATGS